MTRSAHSTRETKMAGLPNFARQFARSFSETPRAREQAPQENTGMCLVTIFSRSSLSGGQPIGITASDVALRIKWAASPLLLRCVASGIAISHPDLTESGSSQSPCLGGINDPTSFLESFLFFVVWRNGDPIDGVRGRPPNTGDGPAS